MAIMMKWREQLVVFADIEGKLDVLRVECTKCTRKGRYQVRATRRQGCSDAH